MACLVSALLLMAYFDRRLLIGLGIDAALAAAAVLRPGWVEHVVG